MSIYPDQEPYPSDEFLVEQHHHQPLKDIIEAILANNSFFGFGTSKIANYEGDTRVEVFDDRIEVYVDGEKILTFREGGVVNESQEEVTESATISKSFTTFTGSTEDQTLTLPSLGAGVSPVSVRNKATVPVNITGSSDLIILYSGESATFLDNGLDWVVF